MSDPLKVVESVTTEVKRAAPEDRQALLAMYETFEPRDGPLGLPPRENPEHWLESLAAFPNLVAFVDGRLAGHGVLCPSGNSAELAVFVHQDFRGQRVGKKLLDELLAEARRLKLRRVWGMTEPDNLPMLRLATACGFVSGNDPYEFYLDLQGESRSQAKETCCSCDCG